ncbi:MULTISPECIES: hypothetical protein [unclassified Thiocapsa]|uniref:hypothetical protein n=1 Tax=unclassified Thiocapsa TaxID=2641286 RepID=UPI0035B4BBAB
MERLIGNLIPSNLFASLAEGNILHNVFVGVVAALGARRIAPDRRATTIGGAEALDALIMQLLCRAL